MDQDSEIRAGAGDVGNLAVFLRHHGEDFWAEELEHSERLLRKGGYHGGLRLRELFGGMGSLNDLVICAVNRHNVAPVDEDAADAELNLLLGKVRDFAGRFR